MQIFLDANTTPYNIGHNNHTAVVRHSTSSAETILVHRGESLCRYLQRVCACVYCVYVCIYVYIV